MSIAKIDLDSLWQPIAGSSATGADPRRDYSANAPYRKTKDARQAARRAETEAIWGREGVATEGAAPPPKPDWAAVRDGAIRILRETGKDLEVCAWLTEALVRTHGFGGARDGFRLCRELIERYWDQLHPIPQPDEEDDGEFPFRIAAWVGLNGEGTEGTLIAPLRNIGLLPAIEGQSIGVAAFAQAEIDAQRAGRESDSPIPAVYHDAVAKCPQELVKVSRADLQEAIEELTRLDAAFAEKCGDRHPPTAAIADVLRECKRRLDAIARVRLGESEVPTPVSENYQAPAATGTANPGVAVGGPIRTREQAFEMLRQVASFFRTTEPHSVLSYQLEECVRFGRMPLPQLLAELIPNSAALSEVCRRVGIPVAEKPPGE